MVLLHWCKPATKSCPPKRCLFCVWSVSGGWHLRGRRQGWPCAPASPRTEAEHLRAGAGSTLGSRGRRAPGHPVAQSLSADAPQLWNDPGAPGWKGGALGCGFPVAFVVRSPPSFWLRALRQWPTARAIRPQPWMAPRRRPAASATGPPPPPPRPWRISSCRQPAAPGSSASWNGSSPPCNSLAVTFRQR